MAEDKKVALVTGANRGLGLSVTKALAEKGYTVILCSRDKLKGIQMVANFENEGLDIAFCELDVSKEESIAVAYEGVTKNFGRLDVLVNNAGVLLDKEEAKHHSSLFQMERSDFIKTFEINTIGPYQLCEAFFPLMLKQNYGRIVNVSSQLGQLSSMGSGYPAYRLSKIGINGVTRIFASQAAEYNILVNSVDPGWVKTDMGGINAPRSLEEGIDTIIWAATLPEDGPNGLFLRDRQPIEW